MKVIEIPGQQLVRWIFSLVLDHENPMKMVKNIYDSIILITEYNDEDSKSHIGFLMLPDCECEKCTGLKQMILAGIEENRSEQEIIEDVKLYKANLKSMH